MEQEDDPGALIGMDVGGYVVEAEIGRGGMGVVYAATHPMIGKRAAIKILMSELSKNPATVERFVQEARSVNQIGHPSIVDTFAFGTLPDGRSYFVMDLLQGESLRKRVKRSALPVHEAVQLLEEIASALAAAHDKGFIHRDLKPDNVFIVESSSRLEVKLLDFGLAKLMPTATINRAYRTATGTQIGTPEYMSPEQLRGVGVDHRTDIYALGIMAFEILTRSRPHRYSDGTFELGGLTFRQALMVVGVPEELADLIEHLVAREPDERPTLTAVRAVLRRVRPSLQSIPISGVRAVGSEMSISAFDASNLGAGPLVPPPSAPPPTAAPAPLPVSRPPSSYAGLAATSGGTPVKSTRLGVAPAPAQNLRPHPVAAARRSAESKTWLIVALVLAAAATIALVVVLAT